MPQSILTKRVDRGFDATKEDATELPRGSAADGSQNVLYENGLIKTPFGFAQVESESLPLDSGNAVLALGVFAELDKTQHFIAVTEEKIYDRNYVTSAWDDMTQAGQAAGFASVAFPVSMAAVLHTDALALNGDGDDWYHHLLVCPGGVSQVQRWAGKYETDFADLLGADGYHAGSSVQHFALQVGVFYNRPLLISPKEQDANDNYKDNNQRIRWPMAGKAEIWTGPGSGYRDLLDTGGYNVWGALLGTQWIQYQNNSIWSMTHVGGTRVFEPDIEVPNLGLLSAHLLYAKNNVHYFVGSDYNVYAYQGGSSLERIGDKIHRFLHRDLDPTYKKRCWICFDADNSRLWIFIVPNGEIYATEGYAIDVRTGAWMKRDFKHKYTTATSGITAVGLVGATQYTEGLTYAESVALGTTYAAAVTAGDTYDQMLETVLTEERMVVGDSAGYVHQFDEDLTQDDDVDIPSVHITEVYDLGMPGKNKLWPGIRVTAKGTRMIVSYRTGNFETIEDGWIVIAEQTLTGEFVDYEFTVWDTTKRIQFKFSNTVLGAELVTDGDFNSNAQTSWVWGTQGYGNINWSIVSNKAEWDFSNTSQIGYHYNTLYQVLSLTAGYTYRLAFTISGSSFSGDGKIRAFGTGISGGGSIIGDYTTDGSKSVDFTVVAHREIAFRGYESSGNGGTDKATIDNVSVKKILDSSPADGAYSNAPSDFQISNYELIEPAIQGEV